MRLRCVLGLACLLVVVSVVAMAQGPQPPEPLPPDVPVPVNPLFDLAAALGLATMAGQVVAMVFRLLPSVRNQFAPKIAWVVTLISNVALVGDKFADVSGITAVAERFTAGEHVALAGFGLGLLGVAKVLASACLAVGQTALLRAIHEHGNKAIFGLRSGGS